MEVIIFDTIALGIVTKVIPQLVMSFNSMDTILSKLNGKIFNDYGATLAIESIKQLDLQTKIKILKAVICEIDNDKCSDSLNQSLLSLCDCIEQLDIQLNLIYNRIEYNKNIWIMKSLRSYGFENRIKEIKLLANILESRQKLLFEILLINQGRYVLKPIDNTNKKTITINPDNFGIISID